jgi:hypothetical protein
MCLRRVGAITAPLTAGCFFLACCLLASPRLTSDQPAADDQSAPRTTQIGAAQRLLAEAAYHEIYGRNELRNELLRKALQLDPHNETIQSQLGRVKVGDQWIDPSRATIDHDSSPEYREYAEVRQANPDTVAGQLAVANWCRDRQLAVRERAHLERVVWLDPNHEEARRRLGFQRVQNRWVSPAEWQQGSIQREVAAQRLQAWSADVARLDRRLSRTRTQADASRLIAEFTHPSSIPALEQMLGGKNEPTARLVVEHFAGFAQLEATDSLIRFAVLSPWDSVRQAAALGLSPRDMYQYVPTLLAEISSPIIRRSQLITGARGGVLHQITLVRDVQGERQVLELNTLYNRSTPAEEMSADIRDQGQRRVSNIERQTALQQRAQNQAIEQLNDRIMSALRVATGQPIDNDPQAWWNWWNDYNGVYSDGEMPVNLARRYEVVELVDRGPYAVNGSISAPMSVRPTPNRYECLVAGSPVWTERGRVAIEQIQVGDLVLSQNVELGRLEYKPVVRPTTRPAAAIVHLDLETGERISASGGHPFWVSGEGWVKASDVQPGMPLHTIHGAVRVRSKIGGPPQVLYNLVVADNQNYFVGQSGVLNHDNTLRSPTTNWLPGIAR